ncbi:MAG: division/cell wall cluster transcriptional repressor MraZ [Proteobacteria bacterium]|nr:division/cell wall cluster transcriptional repressor MraZ [Pseudomonadota bacterium]
MINNRFRSRTEHTLDAKGRLNFPSRFREVLRQSGSENLMLVPWGNHLRAYPVSEWEALETKLLTQGGENRISSFFRYVVGGAVECTLDKQGRILIPPDLRNDLSLGKDVTVTGMLDWVEIWDKEAWIAETKSTRDNFVEHEASLSRMGIIS